MSRKQTIITPVGERVVNKYVINLFNEMPTAPAKEFELKNVIWTERDGRLVTIVKGAA